MCDQFMHQLFFFGVVVVEGRIMSLLVHGKATTPDRRCYTVKMCWRAPRYCVEILTNLTQHRANVVQPATTRYHLDKYVSDSMLC